MKYILILLLVFLVYKIFFEVKKTPKKPEIGKTTIIKNQKTEPKIRIDSEEVEFEEIRKNEL